MDNYIVSARKYRPSTFKSVVGQQALTTTLKNAIATNKLAHAFLFCGPRGVGKTTCARIFAKTINCLSPTSDGEACNECESCTAFNEQRSYNIHELDAASNNSVDDIRSLTEQVRVPPQIGNYSVYIIDEVHMLSSSAFNAFLKTLEEPPHHAIFILATTEKHKILPTILSRCQIYDFSRISISDIVNHLTYVAEQENIEVEQEALNVLAQKSDGGMRDALSIFDQVVSYTGGNVTYKSVIENLNVLDYDYYFKLTDQILTGDVVNGLLTLSEILNFGFDGNNVITGIASHFRDLLLCKDIQTAQLFEVGASIRDRYIETAKRCENQFLYQAIELVNGADLNYRLSKNKTLLCQLTIIQLCQLSSSPKAEGEKKKSIIKPITSEVNIQNEVGANSSPQPAASTSGQPTVRQVSIPTSQTKSVDTSKNTPLTGGLGISIAALSRPENEVEKNTQVIEPIQSDAFSADQLIDAWKVFAEDLTEGKHLKNTMLSCLPELATENTFRILVNNPVQEQLLMECGTEIMTALRSALKNSLVNMQISISENNEKRQAYTDSEKFNLMAEQNPNVIKLRQIFDLELS